MQISVVLCLCADCGMVSGKLASEKHGRGQKYSLLHLGLPVNDVEKKARRALLVEFLLVPTSFFRSKMTHHSTRGPRVRPFSRFAPK